MSQEQLLKRKVQYLDIGKDPLREDDSSNKVEDPSKFTSEKSGRGPLHDGWQQTCEPIMCCYKAVTIKCQIFGVQTRLENYIEQVLHDFKFMLLLLDGAWHFFEIFQTGLLHDG